MLHDKHFYDEEFSRPEVLFDTLVVMDDVVGIDHEPITEAPEVEPFIDLDEGDDIDEV